MALTERNKNEEQKGKGKETGKKSPSQKTQAEWMQEVEDLKKQLSGQAPTSGTTDDLVKVFSEVLKRTNSPQPTSDNPNFQGFTDFREIDEADYLPQDEWVTYMVPRIFYVISDGIINGKPVKAPYGRIEFTYSHQNTVKNGREEEIFNTATYVCKTAAEKEFLERHHLRNVTFFTNSDDMKEMDVTVLSKIVPIFNSLSKLGSHDLFVRCQKEGLKTSNDVYQMRTALAIHEAKKIHEREVKQLESRTRAHMLDAAMVGQRLS